MVELETEEKKTESGLVITSTKENSYPERAMPRGKVLENGEIKSVKIGDVVFFNKRTSFIVESIGNERKWVVEEKDIIAVEK